MRSSATAQLAAAHRAYHLMHDRPAILEDDAADWLLDPPLSAALRIAPLRWLFWRPLLAKVRPISVLVVVRSRYAEDTLAHFIRNGCRQYVILGAGLDSIAFDYFQPKSTMSYSAYVARPTFLESARSGRLNEIVCQAKKL